MRPALARAARALAAEGLNHGTSGNLSVRRAQGMLITPSGIAADELDSHAMVEMALDGEVVAGALKPSSEWRIHAGLYRARPDISAVVHTHPPFATALSCARRPIPAIHYAVALTGSDHVPCADYATYGSEALAKAVADALGPRARACLMSNHGMVAAGPDLAAAVQLAIEVEFVSRVYWLSLQMPAAQLLSRAEMEQVLDRVAGYGQPG